VDTLRNTRSKGEGAPAPLKTAKFSISTERLLNAVYDDPDQASDAGLKNHILRLRRKIGRDEIYNTMLVFTLRPVLDD
jgi:DNA-binding response OmpR family regulator